VNAVEYKLITERIHLYCPNVHVCFAAELTQLADIASLRAAIGKTMKKHPVLRSRVRMDASGHAYLHIEEHAEPDILTDEYLYSGDWLQVIAREQQKPFDLNRAPLLRFTVLTGTAGAMLVVCIHHILADGMSGVKLLRDILYFLKHPEQEGEEINDGLLEDSALCPGEKLPLPAKLLAAWLNRRWSKAPHVFSGPEYEAMRENYWKTNSHTISAVSLDQARTEKLLETCRENGVTVNTLLITTFLKTVQEIGGRTKANKKAGIAVSVHPNETAIGNFASAVSAEYLYNGKRPLWDNTRIVQALIRKKLAHENSKYFYLIFLKELDPNLTDSMYFSLFSDLKRGAGEALGKLLGYIPKPKGGGITNLGICGLTLDDGIKALWFVPPLVPNADRIVGAVTTDMGLRLVCQYDNGAGREMNKRIFENWTAVLMNI
jgi:hypothetical protein